MFEATIDGLGGSVAGAGVAEPGQDVVAASMQGPSELGEFVEAGWDTVSQTVDDSGQRGLAEGLVGIAVGGDDVLVDGPADLDR